MVCGYPPPPQTSRLCQSKGTGVLKILKEFLIIPVRKRSSLVAVYQKLKPCTYATKEKYQSSSVKC